MITKTLTKRQQAEQEMTYRRLLADKRDQETTEEHLALLTEAMRKAFPPDSEDLHSLDVRRGITFDGYEVFLRDRLLTIKPSLVASAIKNGTLDKLANGYAGRLSSRLFTGREPSIAKYRVLDVERERCFELESLLRAAYGDEYTQKVLDWAVGQAEAIAKRESTRLRIVRRKLEETITNLLTKEGSK